MSTMTVSSIPNLSSYPPYCSGKHLCQICHKKYKCNGEESMHVSNTSSGRCMGEYEQFCPNHTPRQYMKAHIELGDLSNV